MIGILPKHCQAEGNATMPALVEIGNREPQDIFRGHRFKRSRIVTSTRPWRVRQKGHKVDLPANSGGSSGHDDDVCCDYLPYLSLAYSMAPPRAKVMAFHIITDGSPIRIP